MPFPHVSEDGHAPTLTLVITPTLASPDFIDIRIDFASTEIVPDELAEKTRLALDEARIGGRDLVDTIKRFERALRRV